MEDWPAAGFPSRNPAARSSLVISGSGGTPQAGYDVLGSTNLALPRANWTRLLTNALDSGGNFGFSIPVPSNTPLQFYLLQLE